MTFNLLAALRQWLCSRQGGHYWVGTTFPGDEDRGMFTRFSRMQCSHCGYLDPALSGAHPESPA